MLCAAYGPMNLNRGPIDGERFKMNPEHPLRESGLLQLQAYLAEHPDEVVSCDGLRGSCLDDGCLKRGTTWDDFEEAFLCRPLADSDLSGALEGAPFLSRFDFKLCPMTEWLILTFMQVCCLFGMSSCPSRTP